MNIHNFLRGQFLLYQIRSLDKLVKEETQYQAIQAINKNIIELPNPISKERTHLRVSLIDSLLEVYNYNKNRSVEDINIYEISNIYYKENSEYIESLSLCTLISGNYLTNKWNNSTIKSDFYTLKGILENLLTYLGFNKRYQIIKDTKTFLHPGISASILIDKEEVGYIGKIHPSILNDDVYVCELNLEKIWSKKTSKIKIHMFKNILDYIVTIINNLDKSLFF